MSAAIETFHLTRRFGSLTALDGLTLSVERGGVLGLVGPNGAGKTVTVRILAGLMRPSEGGYAILGSLEPHRDPAVRSRMAYISQTLDFPPNMTVTGVLDLCRALYRRNWNDSLAVSLLRRFEIPSERLARELSAGMKLRLAAVCAFAQEPHVLLLDEPAGNLDPLVRREFLALLAENLETFKPAVLLATHRLDALELMADSFVVLDEGRAVFSASMDGFRERCRRVEVRFKTQVPDDFRLPCALCSQAEGGVLSALVMPYAAESIERACAPFGASFEAFPLSLEEFFCRLLSRKGGGKSE